MLLLCHSQRTCFSFCCHYYLYLALDIFISDFCFFIIYAYLKLAYLVSGSLSGSLSVSSVAVYVCSIFSDPDSGAWASISLAPILAELLQDTSACGQMPTRCDWETKLLREVVDWTTLLWKRTRSQLPWWTVCWVCCADGVCTCTPWSPFEMQRCFRPPKIMQRWALNLEQVSQILSSFETRLI